MNDVMLDFETFGTGKNACVCQIGAVYFNNVTGEVGAQFKTNVNARSHVRAGAEIDADTVYWWLQQSDAARQSLLYDGKDVLQAFEELNNFLSSAKRIWSHATFDFVILQYTLKQLDIKPKFSCKAAMDIRTLSYLGGNKKFDTPREGVHHDALADCLHQVKYVTVALNSVRTNRKLISFAQELLED